MDDELLIRARLEEDVARGLANIRRELLATTRASEALGVGGHKGGKGLEEVEKRSVRTKAALRQIDSELKSVSSSLSNTLVSGAKTGATALGLLTGATAAFGLKASSDFQQSRIAFGALLGDVKAGNQLFGQLQAINIKTPFQLNEIAPATQLLLRYGVAANQVVPVLNSLLDAAALSGDPAANLQRLALATGQVISQGRVLGQDARQLAESGINVYDLFAQKLGITQGEARKLGEAGKLSSDVFVQGLINMEGPLAKLQGGAAKLSQTLFGQLSNLKDAIRVRLADAATPLTEQLTQQIAPITALVGNAVDTFGPPVFQLVGFLVDGLSKGLPIVAPLLALIVRGIGQLLTAAGPALAGLEPLGGRIGTSLQRLFLALEPVMPDVVNLLIALIGVLPAMVDLLTQMVPIVTPIVRLITAMLGFGPVNDVVAGLLITLLAYKRVSELTTSLRAFAKLVGIIGTQAEVAGVKANIAYGRFVALAAIGVGVTGLIAGAGKATSGKNSAGGDLAFIGSGAALGAGLGSIIPGAGTLAGAAVGGGLAALYTGFGKAFGDPVVPGATMNGHRAAAGDNSLLRITSGMRNYGVRGSASGHLDGSAVDVAGPGLGSYIQRVRRNGGWAVQEGTGAGMHAHSVPMGDPAANGRGAMAMAGGGWGAVNVHIGQVNGQVDFERGLERALINVEKQRARKAYDPVWDRAAS